MTGTTTTRTRNASSMCIQRIKYLSKGTGLANSSHVCMARFWVFPFPFYHYPIMTKQTLIQQITAKLPPRGNTVVIPKSIRTDFFWNDVGKFQLEAITRSTDINGNEYIRCFLDFFHFGTSTSLNEFSFNQLVKINAILSTVSC